MVASWKEGGVVDGTIALPLFLIGYIREKERL
jgi:hypothetical protein